MKNLLKILVLAITLIGCSMTEEIVVDPVIDDEYTEVTLNTGVGYRLEAARTADVAWDHSQFVNDTIQVEVWFNAGGGTGETVMYTSTYGDLLTQSFRVKRGTYSQIAIHPVDKTLLNPSAPRKDSSIIFAAVTISVTDIQGPIQIELIPRTNYEVMVINASDISAIDTETWDVNIGGVDYKYFYHSHRYEFVITAADDGQTYRVTVDNVIPGRVNHIQIGVGVGFTYDWTKL